MTEETKETIKSNIESSIEDLVTKKVAYGDTYQYSFKEIKTNMVDIVDSAIFPEDRASMGFLVDYNDAATSSTPISLTANTWTTIPNDGAGAFTNLGFLPDTVTRLLDTSTGEVDPTDLNLGSSLLIRNDFTVTPTVNNSALDFQYTLGNGGGGYTLGLALGRLDKGAGIGYRFSMRVDKIYMGDTNTRDNPIGLQVKCSSDATFVNAGISITVVNN